MIDINYKNVLPTIFNYFEDFVDSNYGNLLASISNNSLVSFFKMKPNSNTQFESIGTGFICVLDEELYLMTAYHVFKQIIEEKNNPFYVYIPGILENKNIFEFKKILKIQENANYTRVKIDKDGDTIFIPTNEEIVSKNKVKNNSAIPYVYFSDLNKDGMLEPTSSFMISGFPSNKNQFHKNRDKEPVFNAVNLIFHGAQYEQKLNTIYFFGDKKDNKVESNSAYSPSVKNFIPTGMSGSPVFQFYIKKTEDGPKIKLILIGIFTEFKKNKLQFKATVLQDNRYF